MFDPCSILEEAKTVHAFLESQCTYKHIIYIYIGPYISCVGQLYGARD